MGIIEKRDVIKSVEKNEADILNTDSGNSIKPGQDWPADDTGRFIIRKLDGTFISVQTGEWTGEEWEQPSTEAVDFTPQSEALSHKEGRVYYDEASRSLVYYNDKTEVTMNIGRELWMRGVNNTAEDILNGQVVYADTASGGLPSFNLADADAYDKQVVMGVATMDIPAGEEGEITSFGAVNDFDTSHLTEGAEIYLSTTPGILTSDRPSFPAKAVMVGGCTVSDATNGSVFVIIKEDNYPYQFDGCIVEKQDTEVRVEADNKVYMYVEKLGGGDLPVQLESAVHLLDCTTVKGYAGLPTETRARVELVQGTATVPQYNNIHIELVGGVAELHNTTSYPTVPFAPISQTTIRDYATVTTEGPDANRRVTSSINHDGRGRISYLIERWQQESPKWSSGVTPTATITDLATDIMDFSSLAGVVYQTHRQTMPALQVSVDGITVANGPGGAGIAPFTKVTNLLDICGYTSVDEARNTNSRGHIVIFGLVNKETSECKLMVNLPNALYSGNDAQAFNDYNGTAVNSVEKDLSYTAFLIARIQYDISNADSVRFIDSSGSTTTDGSEIVNLLGTPIGIVGGGAGSASSFIPTLAQVLAEGNDAGATQIKNIADATDPQDATPYSQVEGLVIAGNALRSFAGRPQVTVQDVIDAGDTLISANSETISGTIVFKRGADYHFYGDVYFEGDVTFQCPDNGDRPPTLFFHGDAYIFFDKSLGTTQTLDFGSFGGGAIEFRKNLIIGYVADSDPTNKLVLTGDIYASKILAQSIPGFTRHNRYPLL